VIGSAVSRRYATALFEVARGRGALDEVVGELEFVARLFEENEPFRRFLTHLRIPTPDKRRVLEEAFEGRLSGITLDFLRLVVDKGRTAHLPGMWEEFKRLADEERGICPVKVTSAAELDEDQLNALRTRLEELTGRRVRLSARVDPGVLGGVTVTVGDRVIDGSVKGRLDRLRGFLAGARAEARSRDEQGT